MDERQFSFYARQLVRKESSKLNSMNKYDELELNVYIVWLTKVLQNNKAMLSTNIQDGRYYEVTYNGDKGQFYLDSYIKERNSDYLYKDLNYAKEERK